MKNWTKPKRKFWSLIRIKATEKIFRFALKLKNPKLKFLKSLKEHAEYRLSIRSDDSISCPNNLEVELDAIGFSDLYFPEEFSKLESGLDKLLSDLSYPHIYDKENLIRWFNDIKYDYYNINASSLNIGKLFFESYNDELKNIFHSADIHIKYISHSFITLSIVFKTSDELKSRFSQLIKSTPLSQNEILGFDFKHGILSLSSMPSWRTRSAELEEFFFHINQRVCTLLLEYLDVGFSSSYLLPCVEVLKVNIALQEIPSNQDLSNTSQEFKSCCNFLESIGYPFNFKSIIYSNCDWWRLYQVYRDELFYKKSSNYQILISSISYERANSSLNKNYGQFATLEISYILNDFLSLLALENFYKNLQNIIVDIKTELEPYLSRQMIGEMQFKKLKSSIRKITIINGLEFQSSRIRLGLDEKFFLNYICENITGISRKKRNSEESGLLIDDIKYRIDGIKSFCETQVNLLKLSYEQIISYQSITLNYTLQKYTFLLSIFVAVLTIATFLPEDIRNKLFDWLWNLINQFWAYLQKRK